MPSNRKHANIYSVLFKIREQTSQSIGIELVLQNLKYHLSLANLIIIFTGVHAEKKNEHFLVTDMETLAIEYISKVAKTVIKEHSLNIIYL